jgi:hypothetical protein
MFTAVWCELLRMTGSGKSIRLDRPTAPDRSASLDLIRRWTVTSDPFPPVVNVCFTATFQLKAEFEENQPILQRRGQS